MPDEEWNAMVPWRLSSEAWKPGSTSGMTKSGVELERVIASADITGRLTTAAAQKVRDEFDHIKRLEFTLENIFSFIEGCYSSAICHADRIVV